MSILFMVPAISSASELTPIDEEMTPSELYTYFWEITSVTNTGTTFGAWREGPTGVGPGSININQGTSVNRSFTNTISGGYSIGKGSIEATLGVTIGKSTTYGTSYTVDLAMGERKTIIFRPKIQNHRIVSTYWKVPVGVIGEYPVALRTETAYVESFINWDYNFIYGYW